MRNSKRIKNSARYITSILLVCMLFLSSLSRIAHAANTPKKSYPQHTAYTKGVIKPNHITQAKMDKEVARLYQEWKTKYVKQNPNASNQYYVWYSDGDWFKDGDADDKIAITVSEAHGYGMVITALMAGKDKDAKTYFDGMYRYFREHPSSNNKDLMAWRQGLKDGKIIDISGANSATDGDMDIAYSLILAHKQWGSNGAINYIAEAKKVINAIMKDDVNQTDWYLKVGDWATGDYAKLTRTSDFMMSHLKAFREVSGDSRWDKVIDKTYNIIHSVYKEYSPKTGILPDFLVNVDGKFIPPTGTVLETDNDGALGYNACRTSFRVATDYILTGDKRAVAELKALNEWIRKSTGNKPEKIYSGYQLDGTLIEGRDYEDICFSSPFMVCAMIDSKNQKWLNDLWDHNLKVKTEDDLYFGNSLRLMTAIVVSGNWW